MSWSATNAVLRTGGTPTVRDAPTAEWAASTAGMTGTAVLPPLPNYAQAVAVEPTSGPARPFDISRASVLDRARAAECLTAAVYYEAGSEGDDGERAVAQVVLNRVRHPAFPATVCGVVYQGSERQGCQFSFACDGATARVPDRRGWAEAARVSGAALAGGVYAPVGLATHYHTFAVRPGWNRGLVMTGAVGAHFFHRWRGWWGTAAAFRRRYIGGEPAAEVHLPVEVAPPAVPVARPLPVEPALGVESLPTPSDDRLPPAPEVLERWKDAGKPLSGGNPGGGQRVLSGEGDERWPTSTTSSRR